MKTFIYGVLVGLIISLLVYIVWEKPHKEPVADPIITYVEDLRKIDSLQFQLDLLSNKVDSSTKVISIKNAVIGKQKKDLLTTKEYADSLEMEYKNNKTLAVCDSLLMIKNNIIIRQDTVIISLESEIGLFNKHVDLLNEVISTKDKILVEKDSTINDLHCAYDWKIRHRFWAWVMGWRCKK